MKLDSIFEPQVVSQPSVQKMSLCAIGTPASGPALPEAMRASAAAASASVLPASTVMKAFSDGFSAAMRSRYCWASSRLETCLAASCAASAERDVSDMALSTWHDGVIEAAPGILETSVCRLDYSMT